MAVLNPNWLRTFVTLIETGHFTQTAEKLFMTQPGVSQHINKLEQACGHVLIKREKKTFVITEQGRLVYHYGIQVAREERALLAQLAFDDPYSGDIRLACSGSVALLLYPQLLQLQIEHPKLLIQLKAAPHYQILEDVKKDKIDLGVITDAPNKMLFDINLIGKEELCLVVPASVNIQGNKAETLSRLGLISHPDAEHYLTLYFAQCGEPELAQLDPATIPIVGSINQIGQILHPVAQGIGFTVLPKSALDDFAQMSQITLVKPNRPVIETLYLVKKKNKELPERYKVVNQLLETVVVVRRFCLFGFFLKLTQVFDNT